MLNELVSNLSDNDSANDQLDIHYSSREQDFTTLFTDYQTAKIPLLSTAGDLIELWDLDKLRAYFEGIKSEKQPQSPSPENHIIPIVERIQQRQRAAVPKPKRPSADSWALLTLETLPFPLFAISLNEKEIFKNEDWMDLEHNHQPILSKENLIRILKDQLASQIMSSSFKETETLRLPNFLAEKDLCCRIIHEKIPGGTMPIGYLLWIENHAKMEIDEHPSGQQVSLQQFTKKLKAEERSLLLGALEQSGGNHSEAARVLGIPRQTFSYRLRKLDH